MIFLEDAVAVLSRFAEALSENPAGLFALLGTGLLLLFVLYTRKIRFTPLMLTQVGLAVALAGLLGMVRIYHFPQGGSVTPGSMIPLLLIAYRYGPGVGMLGGFLFSLINLMQDPFILHAVQVLFDYPLPAMAMGFAGFFPRHAILSAILAFGGRFLCQFISGVVFFSSYAPEGTSPILYSLSVNGSLVGAECLVCCLLLGVLPLRRLTAEGNI